MNPGEPATSRRITSVDVLRGLVLLLLLPDYSGGFSFHQMAERYPDSALWANLGFLFTHAPWAGARIWDFVMPIFVLAIGLSIPLSYAARSARGASFGVQLVHATVRSVALLLLGLLLTMRVESLVDDFMPYLVIFGLGLPVSAWLADRMQLQGPGSRLALSAGWSLVILGMGWGWVIFHFERLGAYNLAQILILLGLSYWPAFLMVRWSTAAQVGAAAAILIAYSAAFQLYPAPAGAVTDGSLLSAVSVHWQNGSNVAAALDRWLLTSLPHVEPYRGSSQGYTTLQFVPMIVTLLSGMIVGRWMLAGHGQEWVAKRIALFSLGQVLAGALLAVVFVPLIKTLWTPSWALYSTGVALAPLSVLYYVCDVKGRKGWAQPLVILGSNAILLYTLAVHERWRIVGAWEALLADRLTSLPWQPLAEALLVLLTLWLFGWVLYRRRVLLRI